jgi:predicted Zn-dependent protease
MLKAEIEVSQQTGNKDRILEHEIGHALGWDHFNKRGHILHPRWESGGYLDDFVRNDYQRSDLEGD